MKQILTTSTLLCCLFTAPASIWAEQQVPSQDTQKFPRWSSTVRGGIVHQFDSSLDNGGDYEKESYNIGFSQGYASSPQSSISIAASYSYDDYSFSGGDQGGFAELSPWNNVHSLSLSTPVRVGINQRWTGFFIPSVRSSGDSAAKFSHTVMGGVLTGASYTFSENLTLGPGIGVFSQLEDSATILPILLVNWKITDKLSLETGRGLAATLGPGIILNYQATPEYRFSLGGRIEKLRFRLDKHADVADGVGEESSYPLFAGITYLPNQQSSLSLVGGVELDPTLKVEDDDGNRVMKEDADPAIYAGITFSAQF